MSEIRILPQQEERVETGPVQVGDDWPGLFIRGDNCLVFSVALRNLLADPNNKYTKLQVQGFVELLESPLQGKTKNLPLLIARTHLAPTQVSDCPFGCKDGYYEDGPGWVEGEWKLCPIHGEKETETA